MKDFNFDFFKNEVSTKYNDMNGLVAMDGHLGISELYHLCEKSGVDLDEYDLIGLTFYDGETIGRYKISIAALLIKKGEEITEAGETNIYKKVFYMDYKDLGKYIKRLNFGVALKNAVATITKPHFVELDYDQERDY